MDCWRSRHANEQVVRVRVDLTALAQRMARECLNATQKRNGVSYPGRPMTVEADGFTDVGRAAQPDGPTRAIPLNRGGD
jgi:hypothetical protein